jgi:hypothetical protein
MRHHPILDELEASLAGLVPNEPVEFSGDWLPTMRRTYEVASQIGTGSGPFVDVVDWRWLGGLSCAVPIAAVAFLVTTAECFWSKSAPPASPVAVDVSFRAYADYSQNLATLATNIGGAVLPGVTVACTSDPVAICTLGNNRLTTAHVEPLAQTAEAAFVVLLLPAQSLKIGRHRLWRIREELASSLPRRVRDILTRRRSGSIPWE